MGTQAMRRRDAVYALYRDEEFVDCGTAEELAKRMGVKPETVRWHSTPTGRRRCRRTVVVRVE